MGAECPYQAQCSRNTSFVPDQVTAATGVLQGAIGDTIQGEERIRRGLLWKKTGTSRSIPLEHLPVCSLVCNGNDVYAGRLLFEGVSPVEGQIGCMVTEEGTALLKLAAEERYNCLRYKHFAGNSVVLEFSEE